MKRFPLFLYALLVILGASGLSILHAGEPPRHLVFAHYMVCYTSDVAFCKREIQLAQRHGIDGFALNTGGWINADGTANPNVASVERMYQAAKELDSGFKLFLSADATGRAALKENQRDMVLRFVDHPNQFRHDGKPVFSAWAGSPETYGPALEELRGEGTPVFFVPFISFPPFSANLSERRVRSYFQGYSFMDGYFYFAPDQTPAEMIANNTTARRVTQELGKIYMAGVCPAYNSSNVRDYQGMAGYDAIWRGIIRDDADWVEIVTWNDYQEDSNLYPFRFSYPTLGEQFYLSRDASFLDLTAYYSAWFKSGRQPAIEQEKVFYAYRNRPKTLTQAWDHQQRRWVDVTREAGSQRFVDQIHDDLEDRVYVTTVLKEPADLVVSLGGKRRQFRQPAGIAHASVPLRTGAPRFELRRGGRVLLAFDGRKEIIETATEENAVNGAHLVNRTWTGGAAVGEATRLEARRGTLQGKAIALKHGVRIPTEKDSGVKLAASGLKTATYNLRVTYRNPAPLEARLTLIANGVERSQKTPPHFIPVFLPPTGEAAKTVSFFWPLFAETTELELTCQFPEPLKSDAHPWSADRGGVEIETVELVSVEELPKDASERRERAWPEMVEIPGGSFSMGSTQGAPDEQPVRRVTLALFALGRYEVTNDDYERFDPDHRRLRDTFSWRGGDPVIYVSWQQAARYCNWLSRRASLEPVYDERTWKINLVAGGFRLPSEAQWEYTASGRGEGRPYPWGKEVPTPERGNFRLRAALEIPSVPEGEPRGSVVPVGSYALGASRDGVMDLAGNVAEWCSDTYAPYPPEADTDPLCLQESRYRVIRGGSWGYYNYSQRVTDREFNSPGYPGYIYIGLRVALPQASWERLKPENAAAPVHPND